MRIGIVGPPFIEMPPRRYGETELFIAKLACDLHTGRHDVTVYGNGESRLPCRVKWRYRHWEWPIDEDGGTSFLKNSDDSSWAVHDAAGPVDVLHLNDSPAMRFTRFIDVPTRLTIHHPHEPNFSRIQ